MRVAGGRSPGFRSRRRSRSPILSASDRRDHRANGRIMAIPDSLVTAYDNLLRIIPNPLTAEEDAERVRTGKRLPDVDPVALHDGARRFVDALSADPAVAAELSRRGTLCTKLTGDGSEYSLAAKAAQKALDDWNRTAQFAEDRVYLDVLKDAVFDLFHFHPTEDLVAELREKGKSMTLRQALHVCPERLVVEIVAPEELVAEVREKYEKIKWLLGEDGVPKTIRPPLASWRDAAWAIVSRGENESLDGCYWLLHADNLQDDYYVPAAAPKVRQAAVALVRWYDAPSNAGAAAVTIALIEATRVFGFKTPKELSCFLDRHPEVKQDRPRTKTGKPHLRRRNVGLLDLAHAISKDDKIISDPMRRARMEARLKKARLDKELEGRVLAYITGKTK
jgi:hypothetical protein